MTIRIEEYIEQKILSHNIIILFILKIYNTYYNKFIISSCKKKKKTLTKDIF